MTSKLPVCRECGHKAHWLGTHLMQEHGMTIEEYLAKHEGAPTASEEAIAKFNARRKARALPPNVEDLTVDFAGTEFKVNYKVPLSVCAPHEPWYHPPKYGDQGENVEDVFLHLEGDDSPLYVHGPAGTGKDAAFQKWSYLTRTPCLMVQINPDVDVSKFLYSHEIGETGTFYKEGKLLKALRDGYVCDDGTRVPYLIILTDVDRMTEEQGEHLRMIIDSVSGRIATPDGGVEKVLKGTRIVATANSAGNGSTGGRYASSRVVDASIMSRFTFKFEYTTLDWRDEKPILVGRFPILARHGGDNLWGQVEKSVKAIRDAINADFGGIDMEFGHRELVAWMKSTAIYAKRSLKKDGKIAPDVLKRGFKVVLRSVEGTTRKDLERLVNVHIDGGIIDSGDTSHIDEGELHSF